MKRAYFQWQGLVETANEPVPDCEVEICVTMCVNTIFAVWNVKNVNRFLCIVM